MATLKKLSVHGDKSKSKVYFFLNGDFNVTDITAIIGLEPTCSFNKGDINRIFVKKDGSPSCYEFSQWCYGTEYEYTRDIDEQCDRIVSQLNKKQDEIVSVTSKYNCYVGFEIVSVIEKGLTPGLGLNQKIMNFCTSVKANIDIDIYANPYDESENTIEIDLPDDNNT